ncbi:hypothetical protein [Micromonospora zhanjiangensis]|uniref:Polymerase nucleotidyl transferase domain-containing protein n=1 Tax=Micromonospora zhanjiangensis TaxID=1522057 RepID=A0ABV8KR43_9ACTN
MFTSPPAVLGFSRRLEAPQWVTDVLVAGTLATGDYIPCVSDLDLVAFVDVDVDA